MKCPDCSSTNGLCEEINLELGEVTGYHCSLCGFDSEVAIEIE